MWEYKIINEKLIFPGKLEKELNMLAKEGWELQFVNTDGQYQVCYLRRSITE